MQSKADRILNIESIQPNNGLLFGESLKALLASFIAIDPDCPVGKTPIQYLTDLIACSESSASAWLRGELNKPNKKFSDKHMKSLIQEVWRKQQDWPIKIVTARDLVALCKSAGDQYFYAIQEKYWFLRLITAAPYQFHNDAVSEGITDRNIGKFFSDLISDKTKVHVRREVFNKNGSPLVLLSGPPGFGKSFTLSYVITLAETSKLWDEVYIHSLKNQSITQVLDALFRQLTGFDGHEFGINDVTPVLQILLSEQERLFLLDDVYGVEDVRIFLNVIDQKKSKLVITTNNPQLIDCYKYKENHIPLSELHRDQVKKYFVQKFGVKGKQDEISMIEQIFDIVDYNPLSIYFSMRYAEKRGLRETWMHLKNNYLPELPGELSRSDIPVETAYANVKSGLGEDLLLNLLIAAAAGCYVVETHSLIDILGLSPQNSENAIKFLEANGLIKRQGSNNADEWFICNLTYRLSRRRLHDKEVIEHAYRWHTKLMESKYIFFGFGGSDPNEALAELRQSVMKWLRSS